MRPETASVRSIAARIAQSTPRTLPALLTDARIYLDDAAARLGLQSVVSRVRVNSSVPATATHIASALLSFALYGDAETARDCYRVISAHHAATLRQSDAAPNHNGPCLPDGVHAPELPARNVHHVPAGALDWQTQPVIGINPAIWAEGLELAQAIEKRAKRIQGSPRREKPVCAPLAPMVRGKYRMRPAPSPPVSARAVERLAAKWGAR